jgi:hypothetical protein
MVIWYIFPFFGPLCQEKSGNLVSEAKTFNRKTANEKRSYLIPKFFVGRQTL